jgi:hypothetical protein
MVHIVLPMTCLVESRCAAMTRVKEARVMRCCASYVSAVEAGNVRHWRAWAMTRVTTHVRCDDAPHWCLWCKAERSMLCVLLTTCLINDARQEVSVKRQRRASQVTCVTAAESMLCVYSMPSLSNDASHAMMRVTTHVWCSRSWSWLNKRKD